MNEVRKYIERVLEKYQMKFGYNDVVKCYSESHRFFHTMQHIEKIINIILNISNLTEYEKDILVLATIYHDIIYNPQKNDNEEQSAFLLKEHAPFPWNNDVIHAYEIIISTKTHQKTGDKLIDIFLDLDMATLSDTSFIEMLQYERLVFKEYQFVDYKTYKEARKQFLLKTLEQPYGKKNEANIKLLIDWVDNSIINVGVYAGSFNPFHKGHFDILRKSQNIFDKVILAIGINPEKSNDDSYIEILKNNVNFLKGKLNVEVCFYEGLLTEFIKEKQTNDKINITLVRGLRDGFDLSYENKQIQFMKDIYSDLKVVYIQSDRELDHISSSSIRILQKYNPDLANKYLI